MNDNTFFKPTPLYKEFMILDLIEKNKEGWCGEVPVKFKPQQMKFYEEGQPWNDGRIKSGTTYYSPLPTEPEENPF